MSSTREAYGAALTELAEKYEFFVFDADLSKATQTIHFAKKYPDRFTDMGIAECNMMGYAAGYAASGAVVFASTFAAFAAGRAYDQIRNSIAYPNLNVKIAATHGGVLIGADGGSHQCVEDLALMRAVPNMTILYPADTIETKKCVEEAINHKGPVYLRFGRLDSPEIYTEKKDCRASIGKRTLLREGQDLTIVAAGDLVSRALEAAKEMEKNGICADVIDMASVKPVDAELLLDSVRKTGCAVTAEDHNILGGLGGAVSEVFSKNYPVPVEMVGIQDMFGCSGTPKELAEHYGLTIENIVAAAHRVIRRKEGKS